MRKKQIKISQELQSFKNQQDKGLFTFYLQNDQQLHNNHHQNNHDNQFQNIFNLKKRIKIFSQEKHTNNQSNKINNNDNQQIQKNHHQYQIRNKFSNNSSIPSPPYHMIDNQRQYLNRQKQIHRNLYNSVKIRTQPCELSKRSSYQVSHKNLHKYDNDFFKLLNNANEIKALEQLMLQKQMVDQFKGQKQRLSSLHRNFDPQIYRRKALKESILNREILRNEKQVKKIHQNNNNRSNQTQISKEKLIGILQGCSQLSNRLEPIKYTYKFLPTTKILKKKSLNIQSTCQGQENQSQIEQKKQTEQKRGKDTLQKLFNYISKRQSTANYPDCSMLLNKRASLQKDKPFSECKNKTISQSVEKNSPEHHHHKRSIATIANIVNRRSVDSSGKCLNKYGYHLNNIEEEGDISQKRRSRRSIKLVKSIDYSSPSMKDSDMKISVLLSLMSKVKQKYMKY